MPTARRLKRVKHGGVRPAQTPFRVGIQRVSVYRRMTKKRADWLIYVNAGSCRRVAAEFFGTFWLTFGGCGAAVLAAGFPALGIGFLGVALAFGLTVLTMAYAVGHISGRHFNPAVTVGLWSAGRCAKQHVLPYIIAQVVGAIAAAAVLWMIASGKAGWVPDGFAANGYGNLSPGKYSLPACFVTEALLTFFFIFIIVGTTSKGAAVGFAGIPIGLALSLIHLISIPVTNTSVNPAHRYLGPRYLLEASISDSSGYSGRPL